VIRWSVKPRMEQPIPTQLELAFGEEV